MEQDGESRELAPLDGQGGLPLTYEFFVKARDGHKRDFVFDYAKARRCPHRQLVGTAIGGNTYRCPDCNYFFTIVTAYVEPFHIATVKAAYQLLHAAKEFGMPALQEMLRQPHGQSDGTPQKGVLPDGMTLTDVIEAMDSINVMTPDRGAAELKALVESTWPNEVEIERRIRALRGSALPAKQLQADSLQQLLEARRALGPGDQRPELESGEDGVPALPEAGEPAP